jgi:hypothetical protein
LSDHDGFDIAATENGVGSLGNRVRDRRIFERGDLSAAGTLALVVGRKITRVAGIKAGTSLVTRYTLP